MVRGAPVEQGPGCRHFGDRHIADAAALSSKSLYAVRISSLSALSGRRGDACAAIGFMVTQSNDRRLAADRQVALHKAIEELRPIFGNATPFNDDARPPADRTAQRDLRAAVGVLPRLDSGREVQSVQDPHSASSVVLLGAGPDADPAPRTWWWVSGIVGIATRGVRHDDDASDAAARFSRALPIAPSESCSSSKALSPKPSGSMTRRRSLISMPASRQSAIACACPRRPSISTRFWRISR